jgi:hypothetical protein
VALLERSGNNTGGNQSYKDQEQGSGHKH